MQAVGGNAWLSAHKAWKRVSLSNGLATFYLCERIQIIRRPLTHGLLFLL